MLLLFLLLLLLPGETLFKVETGQQKVRGGVQQNQINNFFSFLLFFSSSEGNETISVYSTVCARKRKCVKDEGGRRGPRSKTKSRRYNVSGHQLKGRRGRKKRRRRIVRNGQADYTARHGTSSNSAGSAASTKRNEKLLTSADRPPPSPPPQNENL